MDYFRKCMEPVEKVLRDAKIAKSQVRQTDGWPEGERGREERRREERRREERRKEERRKEERRKDDRGVLDRMVVAIIVLFL